MQPIEYRQHAALLHARLLGVIPHVMYITVRNRAAWHSSTSRQYKHAAAMHIGLDGAKRGAEQWRKQGSHFVILETPGLLLLTPMGLAACVDFHRDDPFSSWDWNFGMKHLTQGVSATQALSALGTMGTWLVKPNPSSIIHGALPIYRPSDDELLTDGASFTEHRSNSMGGAHPLGWSVATRAGVSAASVLAIANAATPERNSSIVEYNEAVAVRLKQAGERYRSRREERLRGQQGIQANDR